jgi:uncharacterized protein
MTRRGIDSNVVIYAHVPSLTFHAQVRAFLLDHLRRADLRLVLTPLTLHEFVHVVTDPKRFAPPVTMSEAIAIARGYLGRSNVECVGVDEKAMLRALDLLEQHQLGGSRIADALLAATLLEHDVTELVTCNGADFAVFEGLIVIDPCAKGAG